MNYVSVAIGLSIGHVLYSFYTERPVNMDALFWSFVGIFTVAVIDTFNPRKP